MLHVEHESDFYESDESRRSKHETIIGIFVSDFN